MIRLAFTLAILGWAAAASAQLYRWTDEKGKIHFSDTAPPPGARDVQKKSLGPSAAKSGETLPFSLQQPMRDFPVTLYTATDCNACPTARRLLNARGIPFKEVSVRSDEQIAELNRATGARSVPALIVGPTVINGFEQTSYEKALDAAGYPKLGALPARNQREPEAPAPK
jgi:glutaredoxin